ncbi:alpha/beta hydrolase [Arthrobacter sp. APC 3897]|uniref:alpha/beta fold hydrolase n=1 Tax=Arthrobacter sp. APC 3897 TaxID=3035204 RepID=UPI0025B5EF51|nr:alpha/beta hydrolase [Arthrobacter sp. APC 3897]MDN3480649.1 alpha/beta hydrolase [Arthrobacter sp. APC 3897]
MTENETTTIKSRYVDLPSGQIHIRGSLDGDTRTPVLLLHMTALSSAVYEQALIPLAESIRPIAIDTPGFGCSDRLDSKPSIEKYSDVVHNLVSELGLKRPALVGQHTGTSIAIEYALRHPDDVSALVLCGVPVVTEAQAAARLEGKQSVELDESGSHVTSAWNGSRKKHPRLSLDTATRYLSDELRAGPESYIEAYTAVYTYPIERKLAELSALSVPVLLLYGTEDCIADLQGRGAEILSGASVLTLDGLTDFLADDDPAAFADAIKRFLSEQPSSVSC